MATLTWNGTTQYTEFGTLTGGLENATVGDHTVVDLVKLSAWAAFNDSCAIVDSTRLVTYAGTKFTNANFQAYDVTPRTAGDDSINHGTSTTSWYMKAITFAVADTPDVTFHFRDHTANAAWTHTAAAVSPGNAPAGTPGAGGFIQHGRWQSSDFFHGNIAVTAVFAGRLTNAQLDELKANDKTSDWWNCSFGRPLHLVQFNVVETALVDLTGNSVRVAPAAAPTLAGGDPDRWTFDGTGAVAVEHPRTLILPRSMGPKAVGPLFFAPLQAPNPAAAAPTNVVITGVAGVATASGVAPTVLITVVSVAAAATAVGVVPVDGITVIAVAGAATAVGVVPVDGITVTAVFGTATGVAPPPVDGITVVGIAGAATAVGVVPTDGVSITAPAGAATAVGVAPVDGITVVSIAGVATAVGVVPVDGITVIGVAGAAVAVGVPPVITIGGAQSAGAGLPAFVLGPTHTTRAGAKDTRSSLARGNLSAKYGRVDVRSTNGYRVLRTTSGRLVARSTKIRVDLRLTRLVVLASGKRTYAITRSTATASRTNRSTVAKWSTVSKATIALQRRSIVIARDTHSSRTYNVTRMTTENLSIRTTKVVK